MSSIDAEIGPIRGSLPGLSDAEALDVIGTVAPGIVSALEEVTEELAALSPPESLQADHDLIVRYAGDLVELVTEWRDAADRGDLSVAQSQQSPLGELFCSTVDELSSAITPLANVHFGVPCDRGPDGPPPGGPPPGAPPP